LQALLGDDANGRGGVGDYPALVLHGVGIWCLHFLGYHPNFVSLGHLLVGAKEDSVLEAAFLDVERHLRVIAGYNLCLWALAAALGFGLREVVIRSSLDRKVRLFRFNNEWYYLLTGRHWGYKVEDDFNVVAVDALGRYRRELCNLLGHLVDFYLSSDGGLDSLWLEVSRSGSLRTLVRSRALQTSPSSR